MIKSFYSWIRDKKKRLIKSHLYRELKLLEVLEQNNVLINEKPCINFSSNDYLGLSQHPKVIEKTVEGIKKYGAGSGASRLISGNREYHIELEQKLARFKSKEKALLFGSGYLANIALLSTLPGSKDLILSDSLNHASIIDGTRLSKAKTISYPHNNMDWIKSYLEEHRDQYNEVFVVSDSVFSMDGDILYLDKLYEIANQFDIIPIIDEAHSTGVIGENGKGIESYFKIQNPNAIIMGTLGKALGSYGAFVCGREELIDYLINRARPFIYSTAPAPATVISALAALELIAEDKSIYEKLRSNISHLNKQLKLSGISVNTETAILPIIIGEAERVMEITKDLLEIGIYIQGIRPPTVSHRSSRLRLTISALHSFQQIENVVNQLSRVLDTD